MKTFYIIANTEKAESLKLSYEIAEYLTARGKQCMVRRQEQEQSEAHSQLSTEEVEGILVLGGDGTLLRAARELADRRIPFLGINMGHLGYLAEIEEQNVPMALEKLIADVQKKMQKAAADLNFEAAAELRDKMIELKEKLRDFTEEKEGS